MADKANARLASSLFVSMHDELLYLLTIDVGYSGYRKDPEQRQRRNQRGEKTSYVKSQCIR